ncbi:glucose-dependent insulinotropic receptor-like isoform X1 [Leguminivora glycinivorella]|uniref:glucose-dependent insulinotropic receptor-like isoform X1 n=1 Tax=Leguminivora glycinivorella TaxID=1035111 RepID=UPI00200F32B3|nr:glucose-dependent insulinotropic receptor-like isoform X1 [Leguminivora glycinivorella]
MENQTASPVMELVTNETLIKQVANFFNVSVANVTNQSVVQQETLFDLYEAYRTQEKEQLTAYKTVAYVVGTLIILSNLIVVVSSGLILRRGQQPKSTYLLLGNVSLADTIIGAAIIFGSVIDNSVASNPLCIFQIGMIVCPAIVSIFSVGLIAVDRYFYILHGLYYQRYFNTTRVRIAIAIIWMIGLILGFMPVTGWVNNELIYTRCYYHALFPGIFVASLPAMGWTGQTFTNYRCWYVALFPRALLIILSVVVLSVIIMVCILYFLILHSAVKTVDRIREIKESYNYNIAFVNKAFETTEAEDSSSSNVDEISKTTVTITISKETITQKTRDSMEMHELKKKNVEENRIGNKLKQRFEAISSYYRKAKAVDSHPSKLKAVKTVLLVTACFVGTWAPYYVSIIVYVKCDIMTNGYDCIPLELLTLGPLYLLGVSNCLLDPIIYAWRHSGFKQTLRNMYWKYVLRNFK